MLAKTSPWGPVAFALAVFGLLAASLGGDLRLSNALALLGLVVVGAGVAFTWRKRQLRDSVWLGVGGVMSGLVLNLIVFAPGLLNNNRVMDVAIPEGDPNRLVSVALDEPMGQGRQLAADEGVDAAKEGIRQDDLFVRLDSVSAGRLPERGPATYLLINFRLTQIRREGTNSFQGFADEKRRPVLTDNLGRSYAFLSHRPRKPFTTKFDMPLEIDHVLAFTLPTADFESLKIGSLNLEVPAAAWGRQGTCRFHIKSIETEAPPDMPKLIAKYKGMLRGPVDTPPDASLGRMLFNKNCMECHTLYGVGSKIGPDLTDRKFPDGRLKRSDPEFLVTNIVDPSAEIDKEYQPSIVTTASGVVYIGIIKENSAKALKLQTASKLVVVPRADIDEIRESKISLMPTELLKSFDGHQVRSLVAYLSGRSQVPLLATHENIVYFSAAPGVGRAEVVQDPLTFWNDLGARWKMDKGDIVTSGRKTAEPAVLISHLLLADDFHMSTQFHAGKDSRCAVQVRDEEKPDLPMTGLRVELVAGDAITLVGMEGSGALFSRRAPPDAGTVKTDSWNKLEIIGTGNRIAVRLNGKDALTMDNVKPARRSLALEGSATDGGQVRFRNLDLRLLSEHKRKS
jgi:putative heme-binding domain-containing protein